MLRFSNASTSTDYNHLILLIQNIDEVARLPLSESQQSYLKEELKEGKAIHFPQSPKISVAFLKAHDQAHQAAEQARVLASSLAKALKPKAQVQLEGASSDLRFAFAEGIALSAYRFEKYFTKKEESEAITSINIAGLSESELAELESLIEGTFLARDLVNEPLSYLTATKLAEEAEAAGQKFGFKVEVLNKKKIESLKMGGLLAVNRGSQDPPTFSILEYKSEQATNSKPIVLVGKGVVYDTGGLSLKPTPGSMDSMKSDMAGAAAVLGTISAIAKAGLKLHVIGLIPATDNRPGLNAYAPGDVVHMFDGSTVEVLNTDAEGRMLLADALAYAKNYEPQIVFDLATLTGAAAIAIGKYGVVAMGTAEDQSFNDLKQAGDQAYERIAQFPFWEEYDELLKSTIADQKNIGGREAGAITAGKFLQKFTDYPWIHLDIAGPAFLNAAHHYRSTGGTGVGVRLMYHYLKAQQWLKLSQE